jgi:DnaJ domain
MSRGFPPQPGSPDSRRLTYQADASGIRTCKCVARLAYRAAPPGALTLAEVIMYQPYPSNGQPAQAGAAIAPGITWYDVLGVMPGAETRKIQRKYEDKASLLRPELISGARPNVVTAVRVAQELLDTAWEVLGDPDSRMRYDEAAGLRRSGGSLGQPGTGIESAGRTGWLGPRRRRSRPTAVPDVRGLFYQVCLEVASSRGLRVRAVRLTEHPMAVDGLVVDQDPRPPTKAHRGGTLMVQVWHPPVRQDDSGYQRAA